MTDPVNHSEAWSLAHIRREESNLARCYIELRLAAKAVMVNIDTGELTAPADPFAAMRKIVNAND